MEKVLGRFSPGDPSSMDQRVVLNNITWQQYVTMSDALGERPQPRMYYLDGALELMSTSFPHEYVKKTLARCLELWAFLTDTRIEGAGQFTQRNRRRLCAAEADECYYVGKAVEGRPPDIAIEIVWTHGGIDRLDIYEGLGVREVWMWEEGVISVHVLERRRWVTRRKSRGLPDVDIELLERCLRTGEQLKTLRMLRRALKQ